MFGNKRLKFTKTASVTSFFQLYTSCWVSDSLLLIGGGGGDSKERENKIELYSCNNDDTLMKLDSVNTGKINAMSLTALAFGNVVIAVSTRYIASFQITLDIVEKSTEFLQKWSIKQTSPWISPFDKDSKDYITTSKVTDSQVLLGTKNGDIYLIGLTLGESQQVSITMNSTLKEKISKKTRKDWTFAGIRDFVLSLPLMEYPNKDEKQEDCSTVIKFERETLEVPLLPFNTKMTKNISDIIAEKNEGAIAMGAVSDEPVSEQFSVYKRVFYHCGNDLLPGDINKKLQQKKAKGKEEARPQPGPEKDISSAIEKLAVEDKEKEDDETNNSDKNEKEEKNITTAQSSLAADKQATAESEDQSDSIEPGKEVISIDVNVDLASGVATVFAISEASVYLRFALKKFYALITDKKTNNLHMVVVETDKSAPSNCKYVDLSQFGPKVSQLMLVPTNMGELNTWGVPPVLDSEIEDRSDKLAKKQQVIEYCIMGLRVSKKESFLSRISLTDGEFSTEISIAKNTFLGKMKFCIESGGLIGVSDYSNERVDFFEPCKNGETANKIASVKQRGTFLQDFTLSPGGLHACLVCVDGFSVHKIKYINQAMSLSSSSDPVYITLFTVTVLMLFIMVFSWDWYKRKEFNNRRRFRPIPWFTSETLKDLRTLGEDIENDVD